VPFNLPEDLKKMKLFWNERNCVMLTDNKKVYRHISEKYCADVWALFETGLVDRLVREGLLQPGKPHESGDAEFPLIIEHPYIRRINYPFEWPAQALKDAAFAILEIEEIANSYGFTISDPGPYNLTIMRGKPIYLDYDSFLPIRQNRIWRGFDGFRDYVLLPLELVEKKFHYIGRSILRDVGRYDPDSSIRKLVRGTGIGYSWTRNWELFREKFINSILQFIAQNRSIRHILKIFRNFLYKVLNSNRTNSNQNLSAVKVRGNFLKTIKNNVGNIKVPEHALNNGENGKQFRKNDNLWKSELEIHGEREVIIRGIVADVNFGSALIFGEDEKISLLLAQNQVSVITIGDDEIFANRLFNLANKNEIDVMPLIMDIRQPTPEYEVNIGTILSAFDRYQSEMVVVLSVRNPTGSKHRVAVGKKTIRLSQLVYWLEKFTQKYLLVEFVPIDENKIDMSQNLTDRWNVDKFKEYFIERFDYERSWNFPPHQNKLLLFKRKPE